jgi:hypothetical protein
MAHIEQKAHQVSFATQSADREARFAEPKLSSSTQNTESSVSMQRAVSVSRTKADGGRNSLDMASQSLPPALEPELGTGAERSETTADELPKAGMSNGLKKLRNTLRFRWTQMFLGAFMT